MSWKVWGFEQTPRSRRDFAAKEEMSYEQNKCEGFNCYGYFCWCFCSIHGFIGCHQNQIICVFFFWGGEGGFVFVWQCQLQCLWKLQVGKVYRQEWMEMFDPADEDGWRKNIPCTPWNETWNQKQSCFFPFKMGDFQVNHVSFPFPGNQLPQGNKGLVDIWSTQILRVTTRCPSLRAESSL